MLYFSDILKKYLANDRLWVLGSMLFSKVSFFVVSIFAARMLSKSELGMVVSVVNYMAFFTPFLGGGAYQGLLKFGSAMQDEKDLRDLGRYSFSYGFWANFLVNLLMLIVAILFFYSEISILWLVLLFSLRFLGLYFIEIIKAKERASFRNKKFALVEWVHSASFLLMSLIFIYLWGLWGYVFALCVSPFSVLLLRIDRSYFRLKPSSVMAFDERRFWRFSLSTSLAYLVQEFQFLIDVFLVGIFFSSDEVAEYKTISLIPLNLLFLARVFIATDYPMLCKNNASASFLRGYVIRYMLLFVPMSLVLLALGIYFADEIMRIFGKDYENQTLFSIFMGSAVFGLLFRIPFSNLLFAIEKTKTHLIISSVSAFILMLMISISVRYEAIEMVAMCSLLSMALSGGLYAIFFYRYR